MARNIVICCDGTGNEFAGHQTNVARLYGTLRHDPNQQIAYYWLGVGTMAPVGVLAPLFQRAARLFGQGLGYGIEADIRDIYIFLMQNYEPGDRVFLFGFSRGAFVVRAVASLLHLYGLLRKGNEHLVLYAMRMSMQLAFGQVERSPAANFRANFSDRECKPFFIGVWDTVSSVGLLFTLFTYPFMAHNPDIAIGRHAVSIDERRAKFRQTLWVRRAPRDLKQVWFPGVHSDVGGGYPEEESGLAKISLQWMLDEASKAGLIIDAAKQNLVLGQSGGPYVAPDPNAKIHESLTRWWWPAELFPVQRYDPVRGRAVYRMNLGRRRIIPPGSLVHASAYLRGSEYSKRIPPDAVRITAD